MSLHWLLFHVLHARDVWAGCSLPGPMASTANVTDDLQLPGRLLTKERAQDQKDASEVIIQTISWYGIAD